MVYTEWRRRGRWLGLVCCLAACQDAPDRHTTREPAGGSSDPDLDGGVDLDARVHTDAGRVVDAAPPWRDAPEELAALDRDRSLLSQQCPASTETDACHRCEAERCCQTYEAYASNAEARANLRCLSACLDSVPGGESCEERCDAQHPRGTEAWAARQACISAHCTDPCADPPVAPDPCLSCEREHCMVELVAATGSKDGYLLLGCVGLCAHDDPPCYSECWARYPSARKMLDRSTECMVSRCPVCI